MSKQALITVIKALRTFGALRAVDGADLSIFPGEVVGLIGPNGSGKSTLVNLVAGALPFESGTLHLDSREATRWSQQQRCHWGLARTRQIAKPLSSMTVLENVMVGAVFGTADFRSMQAARRYSEGVLDELGLSAVAQAFPTDLPIQKLKLLELARALATAPRVLLMDETIAGLSSREADAILDVIKRKRASGMGVLFIEHRMPTMLSISDRIVVLNSGAVLAEGTPQEISRNADVARVYLGIDMNVTAHA